MFIHEDAYKPPTCGIIIFSFLCLVCSASMLGAESATPAVRLESDLATLREEIVPTHAPARPPFAFPESDYGMAKLFTPAPPPKVTIVGAKVITTIIERAFSDKESEAAAMRKEAHERLTKLQKQWSEIKFIARDRY